MLPRPRRLSRPRRRLAGSLALAGTLGALLSAGAAQAQTSVAVTPTITSSGGLYTYSYSVTNFTATDLFIVNLDGLPLVPGALSNFSAPAGFQISPFDPGVGIESFLADSSDFTPGVMISGFSFSSPFAPAMTTFDTEDLNGAATTGTTTGPLIAPAAVPEASTLVSVGAGLLALTFLALRRRASRPGTHS